VWRRAEDGIIAVQFFHSFIYPASLLDYQSNLARRYSYALLFLVARLLFAFYSSTLLLTPQVGLAGSEFRSAGTGVAFSPQHIANDGVSY